jgi:hypothetical protein
MKRKQNVEDTLGDGMISVEVEREIKAVKEAEKEVAEGGPIITKTELCLVVLMFPMQPMILRPRNGIRLEQQVAHMSIRKEKELIRRVENEAEEEDPMDTVDMGEDITVEAAEEEDKILMKLQCQEMHKITIRQWPIVSPLHPVEDEVVLDLVVEPMETEEQEIARDDYAALKKRTNIGIEIILIMN